ncbi:response regulator transcription factor [Clostridiaceae bacterium HSG29]|nr:response regulator transcription factor [Clostridiaceae bacterium HSG29]
MKKIFVVDDDKNIRELIKKYLQNEGYETFLFSSGENVVNDIRRVNPDLIVLDIMMEGINGLDVCKNIRKEYDIPIIFVSARGDEIDRIVGLEIGADDYLSKPFSPRELVIRINNIFKRMNIKKDKNEIIEIGNIIINLSERTVSLDNENIKFTNKEFELFSFLAQNIGVPFKREKLINEIWGYDYFGDLRIIDDLIKRLRKLIGVEKSNVKISTVWGYGYKIEKD